MGTHPVSLGPSDTSCSPLTGHPLQTWRALSPRGASWARCTLGWRGRGNLWQHLPPERRSQTPLSFASSSAQTSVPSHSPLAPQAFPRPAPSAGLLGQPRGPLPAGSALRTLGPSVPGVPGRPRDPWRPWAPGEPRSPGKPRSPCGRDTEERLAREMGSGRDPPTTLDRLCGWEGGHQGWPTGHSLWDPRGRGLQLHRERPGEQEGYMRDWSFSVLSIPPPDLRLSSGTAGRSTTGFTTPDTPGLLGLLSCPCLLGIRRYLSI